MPFNILFWTGVGIVLIGAIVYILWNYCLFKGKYGETRECIGFGIVGAAVIFFTGKPLYGSMALSLWDRTVYSAMLMLAILCITIVLHRRAEKRFGIT